MLYDDERATVVGVLVHVADLSSQPQNVQERVIESVTPVIASDRIWQISDSIAGAFWLVAIGYDEVYALSQARYGEPNWRPYPNRCRVSVDSVPSICASFHDTPSRLAPPCLLRFGQTHVYRNPSGYCVPVQGDLVRGILDRNDAA